MAEETCIECGIVFSMPDSIKRERLRDHKSFYCPNGNGQHYTGKSDLEKLQDTINQKERLITTLINQLREEEDNSRYLERRIRSLKGVITKLKRGKE
jgi:septal ring factor EnvC (AmiA/AmiB activator)